MSMLCPKCGNEVYREDNYECPCEDCTIPIEKSCPTCGCDTYNETGRCESALQLIKAKAQIKALEKELHCYKVDGCEECEYINREREAKTLQTRVEELETAKCPIMQDTTQRGDLAVKNLELIEERSALQTRITELEEHERRARCACDQYGRQFILNSTIGVILFDIKSELYGDPLEHIRDAESISILQAQIKAAVEIFPLCADRDSNVPFSDLLKILTGETVKGVE